MFAFLPSTRPIYTRWRGEWGLLSFMIVCSVTVGASNSTGAARFGGTILGAIFVLINWWITDGEVIGLAALGWLVSFFAFYIMIDRGNGPMARFILLSYNVSSLYAYSLTQTVDDDDDDEGGVNPIITEIALHRVVAVSIGVLWGLVVCRLIWPMPARRKFKEGLAVLYLQMGLIWKRGPLAILLRSDTGLGDGPASYMRTGEQAAMQRYATQLQTLRAAARSEYELRGPFPFEAYGRVMASTQRLLDAFHAMGVVTQKHAGRGRLTKGERALLLHTAEERAQLCARICHVFQVLASSVMLEYPLTDAIPSVMVIRDKLLGKIFQFRKAHSTAIAAAANSENGEGASREHFPLTRTASDGDVIPPGTPPPTSSSSRNAEIKTAATTTATRPSSSRSNSYSAKVLREDAAAAAAAGGALANVPSTDAVEETDYALLYAYALVTGQVAKELKVVEEEIEGLFGRLDEDALLLQ